MKNNSILVIMLLLTLSSTILNAEFRITQTPGRVRLEHIETSDHSDFSPIFSVDLNQPDSIVVVEHDSSETIATSHCAFDIIITFPNPGIGEHSVHVYRSYADTLMSDSLYYQGSVEFTASNESWIGGVSGERSECYNPSTGFISYPLSLHNEWHYSYEFIPDEYNIGVNEEIHRIVSDTTMSNGKQYWTMEHIKLTNPGPPSFKFLRYDEMDGIVYRYSEGSCSDSEYEIYDLNYSEIDPYQWNPCENDPFIFTHLNTFYHHLDSSITVVTDSDGLLHIIEEFQEGLGLTNRFISEISSHYQTLEGWIIDGVEGGTLLSVESKPLKAEGFRLHSAYPNPFNPTTTIQYDISEHTDVSLIIYDVIGREVQTLVSKSLRPGSYSVNWNGSNRDGHQVSGGMYFARLQAGEYSSVVKMVYLP
ncbi:MAG: T9SS type A sorting domain-containing protein [FCB group bacterium]|nr:T9SS type A sorting domain-containing protein [FCB group bacterium]MBL7028053.1 T9SS type A sorting domain-containing protein [Candidatus Neomarinimicrobiota bacterium]MBL7122791.1 T9SS type A sorting domain-containing protein [Candidatus Neomarinimicrobiota bacterium]